MIAYAFCIFASAFPLFLVQPIVAKLILPWFGGSAAVWTGYATPIVPRRDWRLWTDDFNNLVRVPK